ncbi:MAG: PSD1 domain-containing protein [Pirellulaceae bacterium]|nr:PSD1 domain-containing protein [Pirellulaceae bacterium]
MMLPRIVIVACLLAVCIAAQADDALDDNRRLAEQSSFFEREIRPVLIQQCTGCHGPSKQESRLRLDSLEGVLAGGDSGPAIVVGKPQASLLVEALHHRSLGMPPTGKLPDKTIVQFERWIAAGAAWPDSADVVRPITPQVSDQDRQWWAFKPLQKVEPPVAANDKWSQNDVDRFVWQRLVEQGMRPAPQAVQEVLVRRLYFDLIGLPPSPQEIDAFVNDPSPAAYQSLIDRLLDDVRYGEHWARFWLDLVRYSESDGWNKDAYRPHLWRYRDYVIDAFNNDLPYPQFVLDQLAGDESDSDNPSGLVATGFLRLGVYEYNQRDARGQWNDIMNEITDVAGDVFLGLSMSCARCHHHKFDPIPQQDYYKLRAIFEPLIWRDDLVATTQAQKVAHAEKMAQWEQATQSIRHEIAKLLEPYHQRKWKSTVDKFPLDIQACFHMPREDRTSWQEQMAYLVTRQFTEESGGPLSDLSKQDRQRHEELLKQLAEFDHLKPPELPEIMSVTDFAGIISPTIIPGDAKRHSVAPGFLEVLSELDLPRSTSEAVRQGSTGRRTALAKWIAHPRNPLTTRVIVNRIWQQHFGVGLVGTSSDFGQLGDLPTHPDLLDWLTQYFVDQGWSMKRLHRLILSSAVWQQSSLHPEAMVHQQRDPADRLLWRSRVRRLSAEQIRDAMLVMTGEMSPNLGGPSQNENAMRRSIYLQSFRNVNDTFLHAFDLASGLQSVAKRDATTTPLQSLLLLNGQYTLERSTRLASRLLAEHASPTETIRAAFRWTWGIEPRLDDFEQAVRFLEYESGETADQLDIERLGDFCHVLFNSSRFLYVE